MANNLQLQLLSGRRGEENLPISLGALRYPFRNHKFEVLKRKFFPIQVEALTNFYFFFLKLLKVHRDFGAAGNMVPDRS